MLYQEDDLQPGQNRLPDDKKPNAYKVDDDADEQHTEPESQAKPIREGQPMGGHKFGENNVTPSGNDKNNPSQNAGNSNAYFRRTEPAEEHTESNNFKANEDYNYNEGTTDNEKPHK